MTPLAQMVRFMEDLPFEHNTISFGDGLDAFRFAEPLTTPFIMRGLQLVVLAQGVLDCRVGASYYKLAAGDMLITSVDMPTELNILDASEETPCFGWQVQLNTDDTSTVLSRSKEFKQNDNNTSVSASIEGANTELLECILRLILSHETDGVSSVIYQLTSQEMIARLLQSSLHAPLLHVLTTDSKQAQIAQSVNWLNQHYSQPVLSESLAKEVGLNPSTFRQLFKKLTGCSPIQFQKAVRLHQARELLLNTRRDVSAIASDVGYESASQFSREYKRYFGITPKKQQLQQSN